ncbi:MAG: LysM peptidoglycan-binding domain-containing protein, partial [Patescibacteria group bacterium]
MPATPVESIVRERPQGKSYEVQAGDTLSEIAKAQKPAEVKLADAIKRIQKYNHIAEADKIKAGQRIVIPEDWNSEDVLVQQRTGEELQQLREFVAGQAKIKVQEAIPGALRKVKANEFLNSRSIIDALNLLGVDSSLENRKQLYKEFFGKEPPENSTQMNLALLSEIKKLIETASQAPAPAPAAPAAAPEPAPALAPVAPAPAPVAQAPVAQAPVAQAPVAQATVAQAPVAPAPVAPATGAGAEKQGEFNLLLKKHAELVKKFKDADGEPADLGLETEEEAKKVLENWGDENPDENKLDEFIKTFQERIQLLESGIAKANERKLKTEQEAQEQQKKADERKAGVEARIKEFGAVGAEGQVEVGGLEFQP